MNKLYLTLLIPFFICSNAYAEWHLKSIDSNVYYVSTKNNSVSELNYFNTLSGTLTEEGELNININLESVETDIPIRNERVKAMLFEVLLYPRATITATISPEKIKSLKPGETYLETVNFMLTLHGVTQELSTTVKVIKHAHGDILVTPTTPILISAKQFGLEKGIERLRKIARLDSISPTVPVTFNLTFVPK